MGGRKQGTGEMALSVKCLSHKHDGDSSVSCAKLGVLMCAYVPALEEEAGGSLGLVDQTARPNG